MALPNEAAIQADISAVIWVLEQLRLAGGVNSPNYLTVFDAAVETLPADAAAQVTQALEAQRANIASALSRGTGRAILDPLWRTYARVISAAGDAYINPDGDVRVIIARIGEYMAANSKDVDSSAFTFGTISKDSGTGDGVLNRLTKDENGNDIEAATPEVKQFEVVADEHSGASEHEEIFVVRGEAAERDAIKRDGSSTNARISAISARTVSRHLANPSFDDYSGSAASSPDVTDWVVGTPANVQVDENDTYRDAPGVSTARSLRLDDAVTVTQNLNVRRVEVAPNVPWYCQIAYNRQVGSGTGDLHLTMGSQTVDVTLSAQTGWNILRVPLDENLWPRNWNQEDPAIVVELDNSPTGYTLVDDVIFAPMQFVDGLWYAPVGGVTPWLLQALYSVTDSATDAGIIQRWMRYIYGLHLPHVNDASETWADPS